MQARYSPTNQALHWVTALCMFAILPLAWVMTHAKPETPFQESLFNWHKTLGGIVLLVTLFRIAWRFKDGPPPYPPIIARWDRTLAHLAYWLFFAILLWMPITGYFGSSFGGHATVLFNLIPTPLLTPKDKGLSGLFIQLHNAGQWVVYALILLHLTAVAFHLIWGRDGVLGRMLPPNATEPPAARAP
jgi:cytochrome b561